MKWSAKLGRFAGIDVYVHVTFLLLLAWVAWAYWLETGTLQGVASGLVLILSDWLTWSGAFVSSAAILAA